jgi:hypothetical protein
MGRETMFAVVIMVVVAAAVLGSVFAPNQAALILPLCSLVCVQVLNLLQGAKAAEKADVAAVKADIVATKVEEVAAKADIVAAKVDIVASTATIAESKATALGQAVDETREVSKATHVLVNNNMKIQLELTAQLSRWKSNHEPTEDNIKAAELAEHALEEHLVNQTKADIAAPQSGFGEMPVRTDTQQATAQSTGEAQGSPSSPNPGITSTLPAQLKAGEVDIQAEHVTITEGGKITEITRPTN